MIKINMLNVTSNEHENCLNELMELNSRFDGFVEYDGLVPLNDSSELLEAYEVTNEFYFNIKNVEDCDVLDCLISYVENV